MYCEIWIFSVEVEKWKKKSFTQGLLKQEIRNGYVIYVAEQEAEREDESKEIG